MLLCTNEFDFNKVIPMPESLNIESGSMGEWGMRYLQLKAKHEILWSVDDKQFMERTEKTAKENPDHLQKMIDLGKQYLMNIATFGCTTWYDWRIRNWGTKWGAAETEWVNDNQVEFETAWSFCFPIVEKLSKLFPDVAIEFSYADEDSGSNTGTGTIKNGEEIDCEYPDTGDKRAYEIYLSLHPEYEYELVYDPDLDTYKWIDQDE